MLGKMVEMWGWRFGFLFPISLAVGFTFVPLVKIYLDEKKELKELKQDVMRESMKGN